MSGVEDLQLTCFLLLRPFFAQVAVWQAAFESVRIISSVSGFTLLNVTLKHTPLPGVSLDACS